MAGAELEQRDEQIAEAIEAGRSLRAVRKEFSLSAAELDAALEKLWPIDQQARLRLIKRDIGKLDRLLDVFYAKGLQGDAISAGTAVKIFERLHTLVGLDQQRSSVDLTIAPLQHQETRYEKITAAVMRLRGNGDSAVNALSDSGDKDASH